MYHDRTKLIGSDVDTFGRFYNKSKVIAKKGNTGCYEVVEKPFLMDSILAWTWSTGQKNQVPITRTKTDTMTFDYRANGQYDVWLEVTTTNLKPHKCTDKEEKKKYIRIDGPRPSFELLDTAGCVPFIARVRNTSTNSASYNWYQGDGKVVVSGTLPKDSIVRLKYLSPGKYKVTMIQQDTIFDPVLNKWVNCTSPEWPDTIVEKKEFWVTVYPFSPLNIGGDTVICPNAPAKYTATSKYGEFRKWEWRTSDGQHYNSANKNDSSAIFTWSKSGKYQVIVTGETEKNCEISDTIDVRVDSIRADFRIDTANAKFGRFIFINKSGNGKSFTWIMKNQDNGKLVRTEDRSDMSPVSQEFTDLEPKDEAEADNVNDLTEFHFEICLIATSPAGCTDTVCKTVKFPRSWKPWNVITPDDKDGKNDVFDPHIKGETSYNLEIFNRWGERVFSSTSSDNDWNGRVNNTGAPCPAGTYYYVWKFKLVGDVEKTVKGTITLLRN